jgi:hypothetical protein
MPKRLATRYPNDITFTQPSFELVIWDGTKINIELRGLLRSLFKSFTMRRVDHEMHEFSWRFNVPKVVEFATYDSATNSESTAQAAETIEVQIDKSYDRRYFDLPQDEIVDILIRGVWSEFLQHEIDEGLIVNGLHHRNPHPLNPSS